MGIFRSRFISNSQPASGSLQSFGVCVTVKSFLSLGRQPTYPLATFTLPTLIVGQGGITYGMFRSRLISNEQSSPFSMLNSPVASRLSVEQLVSAFVLTTTFPGVISGQNGGGSNGGQIGGGQS